ncbi:hypothetical protein OCI51_26570 (plasmid) [Lysinibacillus capsici]|uniref:hypothetical protein n=1 Tax=Lysinibacillus capsici TaxID=2115968 RepID=UPI0021DB7554|nr:hypothetical protein [Lysinibacillus capsici]UYB50173.1 hypothetical protein OCI51_26945 [Lysinibacillus capsici]UYB50250.1 hypothetical protein OCI51_26570 [Lysinibacillus capsici]
MNYSVELLKNAKVHGKPHKAGELVNVDNELLEELKEKGLAGTVEELKKSSRSTKSVATQDGE